MNYKLLLMLVLLSVSGALLYTTSKANAQTSGENLQTIVQRLSQKFNLKEQDVQSVFNEHRQEKLKLSEQNYNLMLDQAVKNGSITEAQKQLILAKHNEILKYKLDNQDRFANMNVQQRLDEKQKHREEILNWAKQNNIDTKYLYLVGARNGFMHKGGMMKRMWNGNSNLVQ